MIIDRTTKKAVPTIKNTPEVPMPSPPIGIIVIEKIVFLTKSNKANFYFITLNRN